LIQRYPKETLADEKIQTVILNRIQNAVKVVNSSIHYARCYIPDKIAYILSKQPQLIAHAVGAYYYRDSLQMKVCKKMTKFPAKSSSSHIIRFSRCLYAQLLRQQLDFIPHGYAPLPPDSPSTAAEYKIKSLGYKLSSGFEILYQEAQKNLSKNPNSPHPYSKLIDEILHPFTDTEDPQHYSLARTPDPEDWLHISPDEVGDILQDKQKEMDQYLKSTIPSNTKAPEDNLFDFMVDDMKKFMTKMSDLEGVNFDEEEAGDISDEDEQFYRDEQEEDDLEDEETDPIMAQMEHELNKTTIGKSFVKNNGKTDINLNLVKNFLSSYECQNGDPGPVIYLFERVN